MIIPRDLTEKLQSGLESGTVEIFYNAEDPAKRQFVENTIRSQVQVANAALTERIAQEALGLLNLITTGGNYSFLGQDFEVLGLQGRSGSFVPPRRALPRSSHERAELERVIGFSDLARENLAFSDDVLSVVGEPIRVKSRSLEGERTSLSSFAVALAVSVSIMFITLLLASGMLAIEREENAFARLVRGLVSRNRPVAREGRPGRRLLAGGLPADARGSRSVRGAGVEPLPALAPWPRRRRLSFAALGLAIGALTREVRAASLLAFMLSLPLAFLALVPSGSVAPSLYDLIQAPLGDLPLQADPGRNGRRAQRRRRDRPATAPPGGARPRVRGGRTPRVAPLRLIRVPPRPSRSSACA